MSHRRFIPAPAGNRFAADSICWLPRQPVHPRACGEHPRACGEQIRADSITLDTAGSSPRLRGTAECWWFSALQGRFIPAPAGNRFQAGQSRLSSPVHPRACGEQPSGIGSSPRLRGTDSWFHREASPNDGSSPRLRGTVLRSSNRFIPAPAGNRLIIMSLMVFDLYVALISTNLPPAGDSR